MTTFTYTVDSADEARPSTRSNIIAALTTGGNVYTTITMIILYIAEVYYMNWYGPSGTDANTIYPLGPATALAGVVFGQHVFREWRIITSRQQQSHEFADDTAHTITIDDEGVSIHRPDDYRTIMYWGGLRDVLYYKNNTAELIFTSTRFPVSEEKMGEGLMDFIKAKVVEQQG